MGKAVFVLGSKRHRKVQLRRMRDGFLGSGLGLKGPLCDNRGGVEKIACEIRENKSPEGLVKTTMDALAPQNQSSAVKSVLEVPFVLDSGEERRQNAELHETAGEVASSKTVEYRGSRARPVELPELNMLGVGVLRRLGIKSFFSYLHILQPPGTSVSRDLMCLPCMSVFEDKPQTLLFHQPHTIDVSDLDMPMALEILDSDALLSVLKLRLVVASTMSLMNDLCSRKPHVPHEGILRAKYIGHSLYAALSSWTLEEAEEEAGWAKSRAAAEGLSLRSIREITEEESHFISCPVCHLATAGSLMLCDEAKRELASLSRNILENMENRISDVDAFLSTIIEQMPRAHACMLNLMGYMVFANIINQHIHPLEECDGKTKIM